MTKPMRSVLEIINMSASFLQQRGMKNSRKEAADIVGYCLGLAPMDVYMQFDRPLNEGELELCRGVLKRRAKGEPMQYIRGLVDFYGCSISISRDVLIPRQETEILVDLIAKDLKAKSVDGKILWDLCCGSGCIGLALKNTFPSLDVVLTDISPDALAVAKKNAVANELEVEFLQGDFLEPMQGRFVDVIVCNPPYVAINEFEELEVEVRDFEPRLALVAEDNGLAFYRKLANDLSQVLKPGGTLWLEIGCGQGAAICEIFSFLKPQKMQLLQDWAGLDRFFSLEIE